MVFTPKNIVENIDKIGVWSLCYLTEIAIKHYFEKEWDELVDEYESNTASIMARLCEDWRGTVVRYQNEIGYKKFNKGYVNKF